MLRNLETIVLIASFVGVFITMYLVLAHAEDAAVVMHLHTKQQLTDVSQ